MRVVCDDGALHDKLGEIPRSAEFLTITTTVTYFEQARAE